MKMKKLTAGHLFKTSELDSAISKFGELSYTLGYSIGAEHNAPFDRREAMDSLYIARKELAAELIKIIEQKL